VFLLTAPIPEGTMPSSMLHLRLLSLRRFPPESIMNPRALTALLFLSTSLAPAFEPLKSDTKSPQWNRGETIADYAKRAGLESALTLDLGGGVLWQGMLIPAGTFVMGSPAGETKTAQEAIAEKQHKVTITRPFYMGKLETTEAQYQKVMGNNPSLSKGDDLPVHNITWQNARDFCDKFGKLAGREIQLPTEAQWEYACRADTTTAYYSGNQITDLDKIAWFGANSERKLHPGGQKLPNAWGLYDMLGNVREFVRDLYSATSLADATDPAGPKEGDVKNHVVRGGAYTANAAVALNCRAASRRPTEAPALNGFRIVVTAK
jgi:formylglycine-generating enzyme required for sulfatase activity